MNRLSFLKSLIVAPLAPLALSGKTDGEIVEGKLENCIPQWPYTGIGLYDFQQKIWEDYNTHKNNLFIICRGGSKTYMSHLIASLKFGPQLGNKLRTDRKCWSLTSDKETIVDEFGNDTNHEAILKRAENEDHKTTIFASIRQDNERLLKGAVFSGKWNARFMGYRELPFPDSKFLKQLESSMSERAFKNEILCEFV